MIELRKEQRETVNKGKEILKRYNLLYMACQVRTGKTLMSMTIVKELGFKRPLFVTVKKAIGSIEADYAKLGHKFDRFKVTNWEQLRTKGKPKPGDHDVFIFDEATILGSYPTPGTTAKEAQKLVGKSPVILMSGSPTPESPVQIFHQLWVSYYSPFSPYANFYKWSKDYVKQYDIKDSRGKIIGKQVKQRYVNGFKVNDYSEGLEEKIKEVTKHYMVTLSQQEAGFESFVEEEIIKVKIDSRVYKLMEVLKKKKVYQMACGDYIIADTPVKMQSIFHQISSGTIIASRDIDELDKRSHVIDESKAYYIKSRFAGQKIAIYYKFVAEGELLKKHFPNWIADPAEFNADPNKTFICQFVSGRMGINLSSADCLVMYNIDFSATTYWQVRARMQVHGRTQASKLYWIFSEKGLENFVHKAVVQKKGYTSAYFEKDLMQIGEQAQLQLHGT